MTKKTKSPAELLEEESQLLLGAASNHLIDFSILTNEKYDPNWHHDEIAKELERIESGQFIKDDKKILLVFMPPRHGKSEECTINFPAWYLGRNPDKEIITASYSGDLAVKFGGKTRDLVNSLVYRDIFPGVTLKQGEEGKGEWMTNKGGTYVSVGVGGSTTGKGANCFIAGTLITTEIGKKPIESCKSGERVLSYSNDKNILEWQPIKATLKRVKKRFVKITTISGRRITSTDDHRFFVSGKGYTKAKELKEGQRFRILPVFKTSDSYLLTLWKRVFKSLGRIYQNGKKRSDRSLLWKGMFSSTSFFQTQCKMQDLRRTNRQERKKVLLKEMLAVPQKIKGYSLFILQKIIQSAQSLNKVLFNGLQEQLSFTGYDGQEKSELQTRIRNEQISERVSKKEISSEEKQGQKMHSMRSSGRIGITSQRLQSEKQQGRQSSNGLQKLSYNTSQIQEDTISSITSFEKELDVYDIEVEKNHNFFAEDILVHNCFLIDDPIKNAEEAESEVYRDKTWEWFKTVAWTRLEPNGVMIIILTRWHLDDLAGRILGNDEFKKICKVISYPGIAEADEKYRKLGEALWPNRFNTKELERNKILLGSKNFQALYQQHPIAAENQEFKPHWFKERDRKDIKSSTRRFLTIDTAISQKASADYTGLCDNTVDTDNFWNLKAWRLRVNPLELIDLLFTLQNNNRYEKIGIEKTIYLDAIKPFLDEEQRKRDKFLPIVELSHNQVNKEVRIRSLIPRYESGSVYHIKGECRDLEEELLSFPQAIHDDVSDATAYQSQIARKPYEPNIRRRYQGEENKNPAR